MLFQSLCKRDIGRLVEDRLIDCHTYERALELAKRAHQAARRTAATRPARTGRRRFELLGVTDAKERSNLIDRLYEETTRHFRDVRVTEIQKMEDRRTGGSTRFAVTDHAADAWDALDLTDVIPLAEWVAAHAAGDCEMVNIPSERPVHLARGAMFDNETVYFGKARSEYMVCQSRGEAELIARMAELGVSGEVSVPKTDRTARNLLEMLNARHERTVTRLRKLAINRSADGKTQQEIFDLLERWFVLGKPAAAGRPERSRRRSEVIDIRPAENHHHASGVNRQNRVSVPAAQTGQEQVGGAVAGSLHAVVVVQVAVAEVARSRRGAGGSRSLPTGGSSPSRPAPVPRSPARRRARRRPSRRSRCGPARIGGCRAAADAESRHRCCPPTRLRSGRRSPSSCVTGAYGAPLSKSSPKVMACWIQFVR